MTDVLNAKVTFRYADHDYTATVRNLDSLIDYLRNDDRKGHQIMVVEADCDMTATQVWETIHDNMKNEIVLVALTETYTFRERVKVQTALMTTDLFGFDQVDVLESGGFIDEEVTKMICGRATVWMERKMAWRKGRQEVVAYYFVTTYGSRRDESSLFVEHGEAVREGFKYIQRVK